MKNKILEKASLVLTENGFRKTILKSIHEEPDEDNENEANFLQLY